MIDKALVASLMGILYIVQTFTGMRFWRATADLTPILVWAIP